MANKILVVGSLAYDTISTPLGRAERTLGGSANYFALAASHFSDVVPVGVVGEDYQESDIQHLRERGIDTSGLKRVSGKTFFWEGQYKGDLNEAITIDTQLNVFSDFHPTLSESQKKAEYVFLANIDPDLQMDILSQVEKPRIVAADTMNFWIDSKKSQLKRLFEKIDVLTINEAEAKEFTGEQNAISAAKSLAALGPKGIVIKRGEYGFVLYAEEQFFLLPAVPIDSVVDPTGAGDSFAGAFLGYLSKYDGGIELAALKEAAVAGTVVASFTIQDFGLTRLLVLTKDQIAKRREDYLKSVTLNW